MEVIIFRKYDFVITENKNKKKKKFKAGHPIFYLFIYFFSILIFGQKTSFFYSQIYDINFEF